MAIIKPFRALRPTKKDAAEVAALPYDVYNTEEARKAARKKPKSFLHIDCGETNLKKGTSPHDPKSYLKAKEVFEAWKKEGIFKAEKEECFYVYALTMDGRRETGLVACSSVDDYMNKVILKHELTRADKEEDRVRHVDTLSAQTGPIFLAYKDQKPINKIIGEVIKGRTLFDFTEEDGVRHQVWKISDEKTIKNLVRLFAKVPHTYIADGHHRCASAMRVANMRRQAVSHYTGKEEFNFFLSVLFPESELKILDYNRVVKDLNGLSEKEFFEAVSKKFDVKEVSKKGTPYRPTEKGEFGLYLSGKWYALKFKKKLSGKDPVKKLDVSILQENLLHPILGIADPRTDGRIDFVGGIRGLKELERRVDQDMKLAFSMYPTSMNELFEVADAGKLMPPKSTWFEPKLRSGLFIHPFEEVVEVDLDDLKK